MDATDEKKTIEIEDEKKEVTQPETKLGEKQKVDIQTKTTTTSDEPKEVEKTDEEKEAEYRDKFYKELGINSGDKTNIELFKKFLKLQEGDKKEETVETEKAKAAELENKLAIAEFKAEVLKAGVRATYVDDAVTLMLSKKTGDNFKVNEVIKEFKTKYPVWFAEESKEGTGGTLKSGQSKGGKDEKSLGARLAAQRHKPEGKKSFFS